MFNDVTQPLFRLHIVQAACADQRVQHRRMFATAVRTRESSQPERISLPRLLTEPYVTLSRHTALDHSFDARSKYQWTNSFGYSFLTSVSFR